jgi:hypothetical protein
LRLRKRRCWDGTVLRSCGAAVEGGGERLEVREERTEVGGWRLEGGGRREREEVGGERLNGAAVLRSCGAAVRPRGQAKVKVEKERVLRWEGAAVE